MIKDKIKKEVIDYINEQTSSKQTKFEFSTKIDDNDVSYINYGSESNSNINIMGNDIVVHWSLELLLKEYGVTSFWVDIEKINGYYKIGEYEDLVQNYHFSEKSSLSEIDWTYETNFDDYKFNDTLTIQEVEFDFKNQKCYIKF